MEKYGINNVRGGSFCEIQLREENKKTLNRMITATNDKCFICGEKGHFAKECDNDEENVSTLIYELEDILTKNDLCYRCYRKGHYENECYAKTSISGELIEKEFKKVFCCDYCNKEFNTLKSVTCHENLYCKKKNKKLENNKNVCYKCGREGHYSNNCYASKHINGYFI